MSYMAGLVVRASNVEKLLEDMNSFGRQAFMDAGATDMWITQSVMAGDGYGEIFITSDWDSIDAAVSAPDELRSRPEFIDAMQNAGIQTLRRSLMHIHTQRGELTGKYGSLIISAGAQQDQDTIESNADAIWGHMGKNSNGIRWTQAMAAGPLTGMYATVTTADSLDQLMESSNEMFADPDIMGRMAEMGFQLIQRQLFRNLAD